MQPLTFRQHPKTTNTTALFLFTTKPLGSFFLFSLFWTSVLVFWPGSLAQAFQVQTTAVQAGNKVARWNQSPIRVELHLDGAPDIKDGSDLRAIRDAFASWAAPTCNNLAFDFQLTNNTSFAGNRKDPSDPLSEFTRDGKSVVRFETQTWAWSKLELARNANHFDPQTGEMKEADLLFNAVDYKWSTDQSVGTVDIQTVALARIGFMLGLWLSDIPGALLHPSTDLRIAQRSLSQDDIDGSCFLYPTSGWKDVPPPKPGESPSFAEPTPFPSEPLPSAESSSTSDGGNQLPPSDLDSTIDNPVGGGCQCQSHSSFSWLWLACCVLFGLVFARRRKRSQQTPDLS